MLPRETAPWLGAWIRERAGITWVRRIAPLGLAMLLMACERGKDAPPLDPEMVTLGRQVYAEGCASCHGAEGEGSPNWKVRNELRELPPPPHNAEGHTWMHSDSLLYQTVSEGRADSFNLSDRRTMPAFKDTLSPREIRAVITYLKTLWKREQRLFQWQESLDEPFPAEAA